MKPFEEGIRAFKRGTIVNPHQPDSNRYRDWQFGFDRAYFENLERLEAKSGKTPKIPATNRS
jgi:hypothetical protein